MKTTYTGTTFHPQLIGAKVKLYIYPTNKYEDEDYTDTRLWKNVVTAWDLIQGGDEAVEIENKFPGMLDPYHEYLVLHFDDGSTVTYENTRVAMFIL